MDLLLPAPPTTRERKDAQHKFTRGRTLKKYHTETTHLPELSPISSDKLLPVSETGFPVTQVGNTSEIVQTNLFR